MKTLTEMLREELKMEPECDAEADAMGYDLKVIRDTFKEWLRSVSLCGQFPVIETTRKLLITLVDEP